MKRFLLTIVLLYGCASIGIGLYLLSMRYVPKTIKIHAVKRSSQNLLLPSEIPTVLSIPKMGISLHIFQANIRNNTWETTTEGVSYLSSSPKPGERGNSIMYGHNFPSLLGKLPQVKVGDEIDIIYNDNVEKKFIIAYTTVVDPTQVTVLNPSQDKRITIYTCTSFMDSKRFVAVAIEK